MAVSFFTFTENLDKLELMPQWKCGFATPHDLCANITIPVDDRGIRLFVEEIYAAADF